MSKSLLEKLKQKPISKKQEEFKILLSKPETTSFNPVEVKAQLVDKTKDNIINRQLFLESLNLKVNTREKLPEKDKMVKDFIKEEESNFKDAKSNIISNISKNL